MAIIIDASLVVGLVARDHRSDLISATILRWIEASPLDYRVHLLQ